MKNILVIFSILLISNTATAQVVQQQQIEQLQDAKYIQRSIELLQFQRNQASDNAIVSEARARFYAEELLTAKNKIQDLENEILKLKEKIK